jgi:hypothetical protein
VDDLLIRRYRVDQINEALADLQKGADRGIVVFE